MPKGIKVYAGNDAKDLDKVAEFEIPEGCAKCLLIEPLCDACCTD